MSALARARTALAHRRAARLERAGDPAAAAALLRRAADPLQRALADEVELRAGLVPRHLERTRVELAADADQALARGDHDAVRRLLTRQVALSFHRTVHLDGPESPLAADPAAYLQPVRASTAWQRLTAPTDPDPRERGRGVCVVTDGDLRFLQPLLPHLGDDVRVVSLRDWQGPPLPLTPGEQVAARLDPGAADRPWARALREAVGQPEVVWVEWCQRAAVLASLARLPAPLVVRLHSFEALTAFPHLLDRGQVAALVTVSPAFADFVADLLPDLEGRVHVLPNAVDTARFALPKQPTAARTLGVVGWAAPAKDACWALDVLAALRARDGDWRLHLVGAPPVAGTRYAEQVAARLAQPDVAGAVTQVGQTADVPGALTEIGAVVSSSTREAAPLAVAEAAASGARVAVRDWPLLSRYGGPRGVVPDGWVVSTPEQAADLLHGTQPQPPQADLRPEAVGPSYRALVERVARSA